MKSLPKTQNTLMLYIAMMMFFSSCRKESEPIIIDKQKTVYIAGFETLGNINQAKLWQENGESSVLADQAIVMAMTVSDTDIYVAGYVNAQTVNGAIQTQAVYWKNGNPVYLTNGATSAQVNDIFVVGKDVYAAGYEYMGNIKVAKYWKNGMAFNLTSGIKNAEANGIAVNKNDVYVCGNELNGKIYIAKYWKNGASISLSAGTGYAAAIALKGSDVYVAGSEFPTGSSNPIAKYWKNGTAFNLTDGTQTANAKNIYINDNDIYIVGYDNTKAVLWKNGQQSDIDQNAIANDVWADGNDIYIAGTKKVNAKYLAHYWKNGQITALSSNSSIAAAIAVKP